MSNFFTRFLSALREAYGGLSRTIWVLSLTQLINRSGTMVIFFLAVYLKDELNFSLGQVGVVMALFGCGTLIGVFTGGWLVDRIGYYRVMLGSLILGGMLFIAISFIQTYWLLCAGMFILSACGEAFRPANMSAVSYFSTPANYTRSIALNRLAINLGFSVGPALGGFLASRDYTFIFWADGVSCILAAFILISFIGRKRAQQEQLQAESVPQSGLSPLSDKWFLWFLPITSLYAISFFQFFSTMPLYYKEVESFSEIQIGWLMAINGILVAGIEMLLIYRLQNRWSLYNFIAAGALLLLLCYLTLLFVGGWWWLLCITVVISFSEMLAMPFMNTFMNNRAVKGRRGQFTSFYIMAWTAAQIVTPLAATVLISAGGYNLLWIALAGCCLLVATGIKLLESGMRKSGNAEATG